MNIIHTIQSGSFILGCHPTQSHDTSTNSSWRHPRGVNVWFLFVILRLPLGLEIFSWPKKKNNCYIRQP